MPAVDFSKDVCWVPFGKRLDMTNAGARYMIAHPAAEVGGSVVGHKAYSSANGFLSAHRQKILIFGKDFDGSLTKLGQAAVGRGRKVISGFGDWHFDKNFNKKLAQLSSACVVQTKAMRDEFVRYFSVEPHLIEEPYEGLRCSPKEPAGKTLNLVWFGHASNLSGLLIFLTQIADQPFSICLLVVCNRPDLVLPMLIGLPAVKVDIQVKTLQWSEANQRKAIAWSDAVVIPSQIEKKDMVKGHNRLVCAIHAGRFALVSPLPQYQELADYSYCSDNFVEAVEWLLANPKKAQERVAAGQAYIDTRFAPQVIGRRWRELIETVAG
ncbi:MAG: hypothetical protein FD176_1930 [Rhodospirillaceae bacterium]|nr:MAG: hypothetical protein FD176_1930 [Rhodospirillaceae bacterium]TNC95440.1 MAG: Uncharacterized protein FD119_2564 [Stygiobacter sp.]